MCELGVGGFMGIEDIKTGMKASAILKGTHGENVEYHGTIKTHNDNSITLELEKALPAVNSAIECDMLVTVENVIYHWENAKIAADKKHLQQRALLQSQQDRRFLTVVNILELI